MRESEEMADEARPLIYGKYCHFLLHNSVYICVYLHRVNMKSVFNLSLFFAWELNTEHQTVNYSYPKQKYIFKCPLGFSFSTGKNVVERIHSQSILNMYRLTCVSGFDIEHSLNWSHLKITQRHHVNVTYKWNLRTAMLEYLTETIFPH